MRGRDPGSAWQLRRTRKSLRRNQSRSWNTFFVTTFCRFGFTTIKESFKTFARERKGIKQIAAFFYSMRNWWLCKSQMKDEQHQDSLRWPKRGRFSRLDGGWAVEDMLLLGSSWVSFLSFFLFLSKLYLGGEKKNNDSSVFNLQIVRKRKQWPWSKFLFFSFLSVSGCMNARTTEGAQTVCAPPSITKI